MEQESHQKREAEETEFQSPQIPKICANGCGFFGSSATNNLCSKCYRDILLSTSIETILSSSKKPVDESEKIKLDEGFAAESSVKVPVTEKGLVVEEIKKKPPTNRCSFCNKKVGLMGFKCRCGDVFCSVHRYSEKHGCEFDYKTAAQDAIAKANPVLKADKVNKI